MQMAPQLSPITSVQNCFTLVLIPALATATTGDGGLGIYLSQCIRICLLNVPFQRLIGLGLSRLRQLQ